MSVSVAWAANPVILRETSRLKPIITASVRTITPTLSATDTTAMRSMTPDFSPGAGRAVRHAMKKARFTVRYDLWEIHAK